METKYAYTITGQARGGKNNVLVLKNGQRIPPKIFSDWAKLAVREIQRQGVPKSPIDYPCHVSIVYYAADNRRRDVPALLDGIYHALERAGVVKDDKHLGGEGYVTIFDHRGKCPDPRVEVLIWRKQ